MQSNPSSSPPLDLMFGQFIMPCGVTSQPSPITDHLLISLLYYLHTLFEISLIIIFLSLPLVPFSPQTVSDTWFLSLFQVTIFLFLQTDNPFRLLPTPTAPEIKGFPHWTNLSHLKPYIPPTQKNSPSYILTTTRPCFVKFQ